MPHYEQGDYLATVTAQGFSESQEKKTPFFFLEVTPSQALGVNKMPDRIYPRQVKKYITEATVEYVIKALRDLGWEGKKLQELEPGAPNHHSFVGQEIEVTCSHDGDFDNFDLTYRGGKPAESTPGIAAKLDKVFGMALMTARAKKAPAKAPPVKETVPPAANDDDEVPF